MISQGTLTAYLNLFLTLDPFFIHPVNHIKNEARPNFNYTYISTIYSPRSIKLSISTYLLSVRRPGR
jgi:hypothetical protein